jgi:hypothetical protein
MAFDKSYPIEESVNVKFWLLIKREINIEFLIV